jgi:hypothetical protein
MGNVSSSPKPTHNLTPYQLDKLNQSFLSPLPSFLHPELVSILRTESLDEWISLAHDLTSHSVHSDLFISIFSKITPSSLLLSLVSSFQDLYKMERLLLHLTKQVGTDALSSWFSKSPLLCIIWDAVFTAVFFPAQLEPIIPTTTHRYNLLSPQDILILNSAIPADDRTEEWTRAFLSEDDGKSWTQFAAGLTGGSTIIVIRDKKGILYCC